jgi:Double-GTPase 2
MNAIDRTIYRAQAGADGITVVHTETSIRDQQRAGHWRHRLEPWLWAASSPGSAYLDFGQEAAFIRFLGTAGKRPVWQSAIVLAGQSADLTSTYALELAEPEGLGAGYRDTRIPREGTQPGPRRGDVRARARSADASMALTTVLAHTLQGAQRVIMPGPDPVLAEAVMWGFITILRMLGDARPVSFITCASGNTPDADIPGILMSFRADVRTPLAPDQGFAALAADLTGRFADDPGLLRQVLDEHELPAAPDHSSRISRLLALPPRGQPGNASRKGTATVTTSFGGPAGRVDPVAPATPTVMCPVCLGDIADWGALDYWRWDPTVGEGDYVRIDIPPDLNPTQRARFTHGAYVRCPASSEMTTVAHYLPARYGRFGEPVLLGFVGLTQSGKTHLLASMIGEISGLSGYGMDVTELDRATHHDFLEKSVKPLIAGHQVLPGTPDDASTTLTDAFIVRQANGPERVVALFDVSGGDLARRDSTKEFLWIADGLFFVIDPDHITASKTGDDTFSNVLDIMSQRPKAEPVAAAIVLNKADKARFEEPIARWLRAGNGTLDPAEFLRESADVYAYLEEYQAMELTKPYQAGRKATFHVASPTGGAREGVDKASSYPRGVTPLRVLRPLVAMLAMTGVLTGPQADQIGV